MPSACASRASSPSPLRRIVQLAAAVTSPAASARSAALIRARRTRSANIAGLAGAVRLAEDFGTPLAQALRSLAIEMRATRRQRLQETALRAPVTMLLPTAGFILLPIFAIVLGPIALRLAGGSLF
jgi:pilus assembly protein TadC